MNADMSSVRFRSAHALGALTSLAFVVLLTACGGSDDMTDRQASPGASGSAASIAETPASPDASAVKRD